MLTKRIIPCLDVDKGRVVKGTSFVNIHDAGDPVELAKIYNDQNADEITFLDITASSEAREITLDVVEQVAKNIFIKSKCHLVDAKRWESADSTHAIIFTS